MINSEGFRKRLRLKVHLVFRKKTNQLCAHVTNAAFVVGPMIAIQHDIYCQFG